MTRTTLLARRVLAVIRMIPLAVALALYQLFGNP